MAQEELAEYEQLANVVVAGDTAATSGSHSPRAEVEVAVGVTAATSGRQSQKAEEEPPDHAGVQQLSSAETSGRNATSRAGTP